MKRLWLIATTVGVSVVLGMVLTRGSEKVTAQADRPARYTIIASNPGAADTFTTVNTVWVLDTATGAVSAYTVGKSEEGPFRMVKIAPGPTMR